MEINAQGKNEKVSLGDIFVVERKNGHKTGYFITVSENENNVRLVNMNSGYSNYEGSLDEIVNIYLNSEKEKHSELNLNPIIKYFFIKGYDAVLTAKRTFSCKEF